MTTPNCNLRCSIALCLTYTRRRAKLHAGGALVFDQIRERVGTGIVSPAGLLPTRGISDFNSDAEAVADVVGFTRKPCDVVVANRLAVLRSGVPAEAAS